MQSPNKQEYYEGYWAKGLGIWSPVGVSVNKFEQKLLAEYVPRDASVLDFGCGDGSHAGLYFQSRPHSYTGVDVSQAAVEACRKMGLNAVCYEPGQHVPFGERAFDVVVCFEVLEHLFDPPESLAEIFRVLRNGGRLVGSVPNSVQIANRLLMCLGYFNPGGSPATSLKKPWMDPHIRFFTETTLHALLREVGFRGITIHGSDFSFTHFPVLHKTRGWVKHTLELLSKPFALLGCWWPSLFSHNLYFVAQK